MKIFTSFDTNFKNEIVQREQKKYGKDNVEVISHGKFYYYFFVVLPVILIGLLAIAYLIILFLLGNIVSDDIKVGYYIFGLILFFIIFIPLLSKLFKKYIDYILDFLVATPSYIIYYNQEGILNRKGRTIDVEKIKTITVRKEGLLRSIFNFGNIIILTEGDDQGEGEIDMYFIDNPDKVKQKLFEIINSKDEKK